MKLADPGRSRAILVGVGNYLYLPPLPATINNVEELALCLCDENLWGLPRSHCTVVRNPDSQERVLHGLHDAAEKADDTLIVYFAGHGLRDPDTGELLLGITGSMPGRAYTALPYDYIRRAMRDARARRRVVVLDCCYSGQAIAGMSDPVTAVVDEMSAEGTLVLASAPENKQALSPEGERYTAFTGELISLIRNGLPDGTEFISLQRVFNHTLTELIAKSRPRPQMRTRNTIGDLALVRNRQWNQQQPTEPPIPTPHRTASPVSNVESDGDDFANTESNWIKQLIQHIEAASPSSPSIDTTETLNALGIKHQSVARLAVTIDESIAKAIHQGIRSQLNNQRMTEVRRALIIGDIAAAAASITSTPARRRFGREQPRSFYEEIVEDSRNVIFGVVTQYADWINGFGDPIDAWLTIERKHFPSSDEQPDVSVYLSSPTSQF